MPTIIPTILGSKYSLPPERSGMAISAAVLGLLCLIISIYGFVVIIQPQEGFPIYGERFVEGVVFIFVVVPGIFLSFCALILGTVALIRIRKSKGTLTGMGWAWVGLALTFVSILLLSVATSFTNIF